MLKFGILAAARTEGYREGWAQSSQLSWDDAHENGRALGWTEADAHYKWRGWLGFIAGAAMAAFACWVLT